MQHWELFSCLLAALFLVSDAQEEEWGYRDNGAARWPESYPDCGLNQQSPIMLNAFESQWIWSNILRRDIRIEFRDYSNPGDGTFTNTGHTVNLALNYPDPSTAPRVEMVIDGTVHVYHFLSLHYHWPSEHWIQNRSADLELHMVHRNRANNRTLVLGYLFRENPPCVFRGLVNRGMDYVASVVRRLTQVGSSVNINAFAPQRIMPKTSLVGRSQRACDFFQYSGSLTTPPCTEGVSWFVYSPVICVTPNQMEAFRSVLDASGLPMSGNARPLQPLNSRTVYYLPCEGYGFGRK